MVRRRCPGGHSRGVGLARLPRAVPALPRGDAKPLCVAAAVVLFLVCAFAPTLSRLVAQWASDENYSHGFLVVPFSLYLAWQRRGRIASADAEPSWPGLALVVVSAAAFVAGQFGAELFLTRISFIGMTAGAIGWIFGKGRLRALAAPLLFLLFMVPLPALVFNQITLPLQFVASAAGETLIRAAGIPVLREGNVLQLPSGSLEVVEACSGIRSLVSLTMAGVALGYMRDANRWTVLFGGVAAAPIAIVTNALRIGGTGIASAWAGPAAAEGFFHAFTGVLLFATAVLALVAVCRVAEHVVAAAGRRFAHPGLVP
jgi:exosortase